jgi:hypothetical protein
MASRLGKYMLRSLFVGTGIVAADGFRHSDTVLNQKKTSRRQ